MAHPQIRAGSSELAQDLPLPSITDFEDPVFLNLDLAKPVRHPLIKLSEGTGHHRLEIDGEKYLIFTKKITDFGPVPITIGYYGTESSLEAPIRTVIWAAYAAYRFITHFINSRCHYCTATYPSGQRIRSTGKIHIQSPI